MKDNYDFTNAKRGAVVPNNKERISIRLDPKIIKWFKGKVDEKGGNYQSLINQVLLEYVIRGGESIETVLKKVVSEVIRKELQSQLMKPRPTHPHRSARVPKIPPDRKTA